MAAGTATSLAFRSSGVPGPVIRMARIVSGMASSRHIAAFSGMPSRLVPAWGAEERALAVLTAHGVDNDVIADDRTQPGGILADHPMRVLESGRHRDVDIVFSSTTHETDWWVLHRTEAFDPGSIDDLVEEFATRSRLPRSRARKIAAAHGIEVMNTFNGIERPLSPDVQWRRGGIQVRGMT